MNNGIWVICLCAQWCHICRDLQPGFAGLQATQPGIRWAWIDIEDHADLVDELDIETFPTYLIAGDDGVRLLAPGPTGTDALTAFVRPYAANKARTGPHSPEIETAFQAIRQMLQP